MRGQREVAGHAVVAWRSGRAQVVDALGPEQVPVAVGPDERGWTLARVVVDRGSVVEPRGRSPVDLVEDVARTLRVPGATCLFHDDGRLELVVVEPGRSPVSAVVPSAVAGGAASRAEWAELLRALGRLDRLDDVLSASDAGTAPDRRDRIRAQVTDRRSRAVAEAVGVPDGLLDSDVVASGPVRELVVLPEPDPGTVAVVASALGLTLRTAQAQGLRLVTASQPDGQVLLPVAAGLAAGRTAALVLWRQGEVCGYQLLRRGDVVDLHVWDDTWEVLLPTEADQEFVEVLRSALGPGTGDADVLLDLAPGTRVGVGAVAVRSLLRRPPGTERLSELAELLGLPAAVAHVVTQDQDADDLDWTTVEPGSTRRAVLAAAVAPRADDPWFLRVANRKPWWYRLSDLLWVSAVLVLVRQLWPDGDLSARTAAVILVVMGAFALYDALTPSRPHVPPDQNQA